MENKNLHSSGKKINENNDQDIISNQDDKIHFNPFLPIASERPPPDMNSIGYVTFFPVNPVDK